MANVYKINRTRLVTECFRVTADSEEAALTALGDEMDLPQVTENCELLDVSTLQSQVEFEDEVVLAE